MGTSELKDLSLALVAGWAIVVAAFALFMARSPAWEPKDAEPPEDHHHDHGAHH